MYSSVIGRYVIAGALGADTWNCGNRRKESVEQKRGARAGDDKSEQLGKKRSS